MRSSKAAIKSSQTSKKKKIIAIISLAVVIILAALATYFVYTWLKSFTNDSFRDYIRSFGALGPVVLLALQILQVFIALIPGELLESAAGYAFGPILGTVICYVGVTMGSAIIFFLTKHFGIKMVELFVDANKINQLKFLKDERKRNSLIFVIFFIPGTPKDLITYFVGLTNIKLSTFLTISLIARIPSVVSSTFAGHLLGEGELMNAIILYGITGLVSLIGIIIYNHILKKKNKN